MVHEFLLLHATEHTLADYRQFMNRPDAVRVHDDLLQYMSETLRWIPTVNPAKQNEHGWGLNLYGVTAILSDGGEFAGRLFQCWAELFRLGPDTLDLTGAWSEIEGTPGSGHYSRLTVPRDATVHIMERLFEGCHKVAKSNGSLFLLHLGI